MTVPERSPCKFCNVLVRPPPCERQGLSRYHAACFCHQLAPGCADTTVLVPRGCEQDPLRTASYGTSEQGLLRPLDRRIWPVIAHGVGWWQLKGAVCRTLDGAHSGMVPLSWRVAVRFSTVETGPWPLHVGLVGSGASAPRSVLSRGTSACVDRDETRGIGSPNVGVPSSIGTHATTGANFRR